MGIHSVPAVVAPAKTIAAEPHQAFGALLEKAQAIAAPSTVVRARPNAGPGANAAQSPATARAADEVMAAQKRLDHLLALAQSGRTFTPAQLLAMQAQVFSASQQIDLAGKVVEKATSGVKQVLQTQL